MESLSYTFHKKEKRYFLSDKNQEPFYDKLKIKEFRLSKKDEKLTLKIRIKRKYQFQKIIFKHIKSLDIWFSKFPDTNDLMILKKHKKNNSATLNIYVDQWNYRPLIISSLIL